MKGIERGVVLLLGVLLVAVAWRDVSAYVRLRRPGDRPDIDFLRTTGAGRRVGGEEFLFRAGNFVMLDGVAGVEGGDENPSRHGLGPATRLVLRSGGASKAELKLRFYNGVEGQNLTVRYDGEPLETFTNLGREQVERVYRLPLGPGEHVFQMEYERWNHHGAELAPGDGRGMAVGFSRMELNFE